MCKFSTQFVVILALLLLTTNLNSENRVNNIKITKHEEVYGTLFSLEMDYDTINFMRFGDGSKKPVVLFCQGSLPIPIMIEYPQYMNLGTSVFMDSAFLSICNVIEISMPNTPVSEKVENLEKGTFAYIEEDGHYNKHYLKRDSLDTYVQRANVVIDYISEQEWAKGEPIYVFGHSQGAWVAAKIAEQNKSVAGLGFSSANPDGRIAGFISEIQFEYLRGNIDSIKMLNGINWYYSIWKASVSGVYPENLKSRVIPYNWTSFSISFVNILSRLKMPLFVSYGTEDGKCALRLEQMPIYFMQQGKTNYKMYPVEGCGHNFEPILDNKVHDFENNKWGDVLNEFSKFMEEQVK